MLPQRKTLVVMAAMAALLFPGQYATAEGDWEITPESEEALERGLDWLVANQGKEGNWESNDLGLVSMGALALMAAGYSPGRGGERGKAVEKALDYVMENAKPSGLLNISHAQRDMYNHGLSTFVLGQAHGMTLKKGRINDTLNEALQLIANSQRDDGGWSYFADQRDRRTDLSLCVMQAKALRSAMDSGLEVPPEVVNSAVVYVRNHYCPANGRRDAPEAEQKKMAGQFTYSGGGGGTPAMAAAGVVAMQEFGQYDDWRIGKSVDVIHAQVQSLPKSRRRDGTMPFDAYTLYYIGQALYQVGGDPWKENYPVLRDYLVASQMVDKGNKNQHGMWMDRGARGGGHVGGTPGNLYGTSVGCFILAIPNRYLPILQEGKIAGFENRFGG